MSDTNELQEICSYASSPNDNAPLIGNFDDVPHTHPAPFIAPVVSLDDDADNTIQQHRTSIIISGGMLRGKNEQAAINTSPSSSSRQSVKPFKISNLDGHKSAFEKLINLEERKCKLVYLLLCPMYTDTGDYLGTTINLIKDTTSEVPLSSSTQGAHSQLGQLITTLADQMKLELSSLKGNQKLFANVIRIIN